MWASEVLGLVFIAIELSLKLKLVRFSLWGEFPLHALRFNTVGREKKYVARRMRHNF